jgi:4'-phosphopantetheinyl transferase
MSDRAGAEGGLVWRARPIPAVLGRADHARLHPGDATRAALIAHPAVRARFVVARALLCDTVAALRPALDPATIEVAVEPSGRPRVAGHDDLHVSVAHTRGLAVAVAAEEGPVGIDVEPLARDDLPPTCVWLTAAERGRLGELQPGERRPWLLHLWVAKEAVIKASSVGGPVPRAAVEVDVEGGLATGPVTASLRWHTVDDRYLVVVATASRVQVPDVRARPRRGIGAAPPLAGEETSAHTFPLLPR